MQSGWTLARLTSDHNWVKDVCHAKVGASRCIAQHEWPLVINFHKTRSGCIADLKSKSCRSNLANQKKLTTSSGKIRKGSQSGELPESLSHCRRFLLKNNSRRCKRVMACSAVPMLNGFVAGWCIHRDLGTSLLPAIPRTNPKFWICSNRPFHCRGPRVGIAGLYIQFWNALSSRAPALLPTPCQRWSAWRLGVAVLKQEMYHLVEGYGVQSQLWKEELEVNNCRRCGTVMACSVWIRRINEVRIWTRSAHAAWICSRLMYP